MNEINDWESEALAADIAGIEEDCDGYSSLVDDWLMENFEVTIEQWHKIITILIPRCAQSKGVLENSLRYRGFIDNKHKSYICRIVEEEEPKENE
jgi:ribosomal protein S18 acetylase RimI-like enzyme